MTQPVVLFGATSFVGGEVVRALLAEDRRVIAVTRRPALGQLVLEPSFGLQIASPEDVPRALVGEDFDIVNLAYVKDAQTSKMYESNRTLLGGIEEVAKLGCRRLVHISTAAVFGYRFSTEPVAERAKWRPMGPYAESKIHAERLVARLAKATGTETVTLRLGNVLGAGSPTWTAAIGQRILEGKPVSYAGESGYLNGTHVANVASYVAHLLRESAPMTAANGPIHHLAELSPHRWPELLSAMSQAIGRDRRYASRRTGAGGIDARLRSALKGAYTGRPGSYARAAMAVLPSVGALERLMEDVKSSSAPTGGSAPPVALPADEELLEILCSPYEFRSTTVEGWRPQVDFDATCAETAEWLREAGYSLRTR